MSSFESWKVWCKSNVVIVIVVSWLMTKCFIRAAFLLIIVFLVFSNPSISTIWTFLFKENSLHKMVYEIRAYDLIMGKILKAKLLVTTAPWILDGFSVVLSVVIKSYKVMFHTWNVTGCLLESNEFFHGLLVSDGWHVCPGTKWTACTLRGLRKHVLKFFLWVVC